jgi:hypothetical protein
MSKPVVSCNRKFMVPLIGRSMNNQQLNQICSMAKKHSGFPFHYAKHSVVHKQSNTIITYEVLVHKILTS